MQLLYGTAKLEYNHKIEIAFLSCEVFYFLYCSNFFKLCLRTVFLIEVNSCVICVTVFKMESVFLLSPDRIFFIICILTEYMLHCKYKKRRGQSMRNYINNTLHSHLIYPQKPRPFGSSTAC